MLVSIDQTVGLNNAHRCVSDQMHNLWWKLYSFYIRIKSMHKMEFNINYFVILLIYGQKMVCYSFFVFIFWFVCLFVRCKITVCEHFSWLLWVSVVSLYSNDVARLVRHRQHSDRYNIQLRKQNIYTTFT